MSEHRRTSGNPTNKTQTFKKCKTIAWGTPFPESGHSPPPVLEHGGASAASRASGELCFAAKARVDLTFKPDIGNDNDTGIWISLNCTSTFTGSRLKLVSQAATTCELLERAMDSLTTFASALCRPTKDGVTNRSRRTFVSGSILDPSACLVNDQMALELGQPLQPPR